MINNYRYLRLEYFLNVIIIHINISNVFIPLSQDYFQSVHFTHNTLKLWKNFFEPKKNVDVW